MSENESNDAESILDHALTVEMVRLLKQAAEKVRKLEGGGEGTTTEEPAGESEEGPEEDPD